MVEKEIITQIEEGREGFVSILQNNPGLLVIKFSAKWCKPCKLIKPAVDGFFSMSPPHVACADLDVDMEGNIDVYGYLRAKKMVNGIPVLLCYKKKNLNKEQITFIPDDSVTGSNPTDLDAFFKRCGKHLEDVRINVGLTKL